MKIEIGKFYQSKNTKIVVEALSEENKNTNHFCPTFRGRVVIPGEMKEEVGEIFETFLVENFEEYIESVNTDSDTKILVKASNKYEFTQEELDSYRVVEQYKRFFVEKALTFYKEVYNTALRKVGILSPKLVSEVKWIKIDNKGQRVQGNKEEVSFETIDEAFGFIKTLTPKYHSLK